MARTNNYSHLGARSPRDTGSATTKRRRTGAGPPRWLVIALSPSPSSWSSRSRCGAADPRVNPPTPPPNRGSGDSAPIRTAHGPASITDGVPNGYTRDQDGAATAAVNTVQAVNEAITGRISMDAVERTRIATSATRAVLDVVADGKDPRNYQDTLTMAPAAVTVTSFSADAAKVSIWEMSTSQTSITPEDPKAIRVAWSTEEVSLVWQDGDWKLQDKTFRPGPDPTDPAVTAPPAGSALATPVQQGYYSFFVS